MMPMVAVFEGLDEDAHDTVVGARAIELRLGANRQEFGCFAALEQARETDPQTSLGGAFELELHGQATKLAIGGLDQDVARLLARPRHADTVADALPQ